MIVKVCGMRDAENIRDIEQLGIDWMGFIFYPLSKRAVTDVPDYLTENVKRVGVFVNEDLEIIGNKIEEFQLDMVQLHGEESPEICLQLQQTGVKVIKAFSIKDRFPGSMIERYDSTCNYYLFDTHTTGYGGSGRKFNWELLSQYQGETPFLLSGGISPEDADAVRAFVHPQFIGIDINSRFETEAAIKSSKLIKQFLEKIRK